MMRGESSMKHRHRRAGQALVELALMMTFLTLLLSAAVDLALAFKTYQMLVNATAEASSYLSQQPLVWCGEGCSVTSMKAGANEQAIFNFRHEIGNDFNSNGIARLLDLNSNGQDDMAENLDFAGGSWIRIDPADGSQFDPNNPAAFNIRTFTPTTQQDCIDRKRQYQAGQCFVVVRAKIIYRPFFALAPFIGQTMTIQAHAIKPIVGGS